MNEWDTYWSLYFRQDLHRISAKYMTKTIHTNPVQPEKFWVSDDLLYNYHLPFLLAMFGQQPFRKCSIVFKRTCERTCEKTRTDVFKDTSCSTKMLISANSTIFYISFNFTLIHGSIPVELNGLRFLPFLIGSQQISYTYKKTQGQSKWQWPRTQHVPIPTGQEQCKFFPTCKKCKVMVTINGKEYSHFLPEHL
jgi:hypothetical protein